MPTQSGSRKLALLMFAVFLLSAGLQAIRGLPAPDTSAGPQVQQLDSVQIVTPKQIAQEHRMTLGEKAGRLHPMFVHFPIAWLILLFLLELTVFFIPRAGLTDAGSYMTVLALLSFLPAAATGLLLADYQSKPTPEFLDLMFDHRNLNLTAAGLIAAALVLRRVRRSSYGGLTRLVFFSLVTVSMVLVLLAARLGGQMVYGTDFFPYPF